MLFICACMCLFFTYLECLILAAHANSALISENSCILIGLALFCHYLQDLALNTESVLTEKSSKVKESHQLVP